MPQFDTSFFASQIFWTIISFVILLVVLRCWVLPAIATALQERRRLIEEEISKAQKKHEEMAHLKNEYIRKLSEIDQEAVEVFKAAEKRFDEQRQRMTVEWKEGIERKERAFAEEVEVARQQAMIEVRKESAALVATATEHLIHQKIGQAEARKALQETIDEMEKGFSKEAQRHEKNSY